MREYLRRVKHHIKESCINIDDIKIVDAGANNGCHSILFAKSFPQSTVYSFEPDRRALNKFKNKLSKQPSSVVERINIFETCVGNEDGNITFYESGGSFNKSSNWDCSGSIKKPTQVMTNEYPSITFSPTQHPITKLDTWCNNHGVDEINVIWADIQGAELDMLRGAKDILKTVTFISLECHNPPLYAGDTDLKMIQHHLTDFELVDRGGIDYLFKRKHSQ